ncbi:MAG TPA: right-handed parallel beta-helix repeat-containing protein [Nitrospiraceae bacterium]|nr:right-handed parallel beta-helix repeat-containing protein [Nitrospiraceae bacterium]
MKATSPSAAASRRDRNAVRFFILLLVPAVVVWLAASASAADYYLSPSGDDAHTGASPQQAWKSLSQVNDLDLAPGDRILLEGGARFEGNLLFDAEDRGVGANPIIVTSYGTGRATIDAGNGHGVYAYNTAGISLSRINLFGNGETDHSATGVVFYTDLPGDIKLTGIRLDEIEVSGFSKNGIEIGSWNGRSGFQDVRITHAVIHDNRLNGLITYAERPYTHEQVYVGYVQAYRHVGDRSVQPNSGSGIILGGVKHGTIERSVAHDNGWLGDAGVGIWTYASTGISIQYNESFRNHTAGTHDGGGFDLDGGVTDSVLQYNYSHDNDGAGYLLCQYPEADPWFDNTVRHNISVNDGRKNGYAGIQVWDSGPGLSGGDIHDNLVIIGLSAHGTPSALYFAHGTRRFLIHQNAFITAGAARLMTLAPGQEDLFLMHNRCWSVATPAVIDDAWTTDVLASPPDPTCHEPSRLLTP